MSQLSVVYELYCGGVTAVGVIFLIKGIQELDVMVKAQISQTLLQRQSIQLFEWFILEALRQLGVQLPDRTISQFKNQY